MEAADKLCDALFRWLGNRKKCAEKLLELAQELEDVHQRSNIAQVVGAATSVASISGALIATFLTGGLATPILAVATVGSLAGSAVSVTSTLVETFISSSTFKKATELIKEDEKVGRSIQKLLRDLKVRCGETLKDRCGGALLGAHADELDCEVTTLLMSALARRRNAHVPLDLLRGFNRATFFRHMTPGGLDQAEAMRFIFQALGTATLFSVMTSGLKVSGKEMMKNIELIGIKAAAKAGSAALGVIGLGICLYDLIVKTEELVKDNRVTEASEILRDSARGILDGRQKLEEELDAMQEIIQKLLQMKRSIKNLGGYSLSMNENGQRIIDYIRGTCTDKKVVSWLQGLTHQIEFVNLVRFFQERLTNTEYLTSPVRGHIDIVFVAHGRIVHQFMPSCVLVPTDNIRDTILYSPWNCAIDANTAFAIAQGFIHVSSREFYIDKDGSMAHWEPDPLPDHWNRMRRSRHNIPVIHLSPVTPEDGAWALFQQFWKNRMELEGRVIIPYLLPKCLVKAFGEIPLYMFIFVTSFLLMLYGKTATVHLVACLGRSGSPPRPEEWRRQYAYTSDGTCMTVDLGDRNMNSVLYRALRSLFDRNCR